MFYLLLACNESDSVDTAWVECIPTYTPIDGGDPAVSLEAAEALAASWMVTTVSWSQSPTDETSPMSVTATRTETAATIVEYESPEPSACGEGRGVHLPMDFSFDIGAGAATSSGHGAIEVFAEDLAQSYFLLDAQSGPGVPTALSAEWEQAAKESSDYEGADRATEWWTNCSATLGTLRVSISGTWDDGSDSGTHSYWAGDAVGASE